MKDRKVVIVTGASRGIGEAIAIRFASENFHTVLVGRSADDLERVSSRIHQQFNTETLICVGDVSEPEFLEAVIDQTIERWGRIDVVVNNAAWRTIETMRTISLETWNKTLRICLTAPAFLAKSAAAKMEQLGIKGAIINISSIMSERAGGNSPAYVACKGATDSLTRELAVTYGRSGIRIVTVNPGHIETNMSKDYQSGNGDNLSDQFVDYIVAATPLGRGGKPEEIAEVVYWLSSDAASFISGTTLMADGGFMANLNAYTLKQKQFPHEF